MEVKNRLEHFFAMHPIVIPGQEPFPDEAPDDTPDTEPRLPPETPSPEHNPTIPEPDESPVLN